VPRKSAEEKVRINRILMIDDAIRSGSYPSVAKLAKKSEVNERTIERDIEYLRDMYEAPIEEARLLLLRAEFFHQERYPDRRGTVLYCPFRPSSGAIPQHAACRP